MNTLKKERQEEESKEKYLWLDPNDSSVCLVFNSDLQIKAMLLNI